MSMLRKLILPTKVMIARQVAIKVALDPVRFATKNSSATTKNHFMQWSFSHRIRHWQRQQLNNLHRRIFFNPTGQHALIARDPLEEFELDFSTRTFVLFGHSTKAPNGTRNSQREEQNVVPRYVFGIHTVCS